MRAPQSPYTQPQNLKMWSSWAIAAVLLLVLVPAPTAAQCPNTQNCHCEAMDDGKVVINCRFRGLDKVPSWTASNQMFYELTLAENDITHLDANAFEGVLIKRLDLSANQITSIDPQAFAGLESTLEELILHVNGMNDFPAQALAGLANLKYLMVEGFSMTGLPLNALQNQSKIHTLKMENCQLEHVVSSDFSAFSDQLVMLSLRTNKLQNLPQTTISSLRFLEILDVSHNKLAVLPDNLFSGNQKISMIDFSNNQLQTVRVNAYVGLETSLTSLILQNNQLTDNQLKPLKLLQSLQDLNLANNRIMNIPEDSLVNSQNLQTLVVRTNRMAGLRKAPFEPVKTTLKTLDLDDNVIASIESGFFAEFGNLQVLQLDRQPLHGVLDDSTFVGLEASLRRLTLQETGLTASDLSSVQNLANLTSLNVAKNQIMQIPPLTFSKLTQLATLDLSENSITALSQKSMHGPQSSLTTINLNSNGLETIPECAFFGFTTLNHINLNSNPLKCDCDAVWLRRWIDIKYPGIKKYVLGWQCASPEALKDQKVYDVTEAQLCTGGHTPPQCEALTTAPTPTTTSQTSGAGSHPTTLPPGGGTVHISNITHNAALVSWVPTSGSPLSFTVEVLNKGTSEKKRADKLPPNSRRHWLSGLVASTEYSVCVTFLYVNESRNHATCKDFDTVGEPAAVVGGANVGAIVGAVIGVLAFLALLVLLGFLVVRSRSNGDPLFTKPKCLGGGAEGGGEANTVKSRTPTGIPQIGYNSKRFSRPRTGAASNTTSTTSSVLQNRANNDLEMKLAGFSPEERDHIINMLTTSGGSTMSIISNGSSQRYVPELPPRPQHLEGYLNPQSIHEDDDDPQKHIYDEIPGAQGNYYEVPSGGASNYPARGASDGIRRQSTQSVHSGKYEMYKEPGECYI